MRSQIKQGDINIQRNDSIISLFIQINGIIKYVLGYYNFQLRIQKITSERQNQMNLPNIYRHNIKRNPLKMDFKARFQSNIQQCYHGLNFNNPKSKDRFIEKERKRSLSISRYENKVQKHRSITSMRNYIPAKVHDENELIQKKNKALKLMNFLPHSSERLSIPNIIEIKDHIQNQKPNYKRRMNVFLCKNGFNLLLQNKNNKTQDNTAIKSYIHEKIYFLKIKRQNTNREHFKKNYSEIILKRMTPNE